MASAFDVANYFLERVDRESGDLITQLKLYKLVYYVQAWSLVFRGKPMFEGQIQAWRHGPVPVVLRSEFQRYGDYPIPAPSHVLDLDRVFDGEEKEILQLVLQKYGELSASQLRKLTHKEQPWASARIGFDDDEVSQEEISEEEMRSYYSNFCCIKDGEISISDSAIDLDKEVYVPLEHKDGAIVRVRLSCLEDYILENMDKLQTEVLEYVAI